MDVLTDLHYSLGKTKNDKRTREIFVGSVVRGRGIFMGITSIGNILLVCLVWMEVLLLERAGTEKTKTQMHEWTQYELNRSCA